MARTESRPPIPRFVVRVADPRDRERIFRLRHDVYAVELGQHPISPSGVLTDALDSSNVYLVAALGDEIAGFVSITPPAAGSYSVDKYLRRADFPELASEPLYEVRLLTVALPYRGSEAAGLLMYAAIRWVDAHGGERIVAIGRREVLGLYRRVGLRELGREIRSGAVTYELLHATREELEARMRIFAPVVNRLEGAAEWRLEIPFRRPVPCFHGGAFFDAIGTGFERLDRADDIINADVLDAWFDPAPGVVAAIRERLPWLLRTSPPTHGEGMAGAVARARGLPVECVLPCAGSSDAIFLAFRHWMSRSSRALILDPTYGEYRHVLEEVIRCRTDRLLLDRDRDYRVPIARLERLARRDYDVIILVNPNSPTGQHVPRALLEDVLRRIPQDTLVWVDETYVEYAGTEETVERFAAASSNVVVCKSMSKVYALSGVRAAYLCGPRRVVEGLREITPPWAVSLPAQLAAVAALDDPGYYAERYAETREYRENLRRAISEFPGWGVISGVANFLLCHLPAAGPGAAAYVDRCRSSGLFLRDAGPMGRNMGTHSLRIAVKGPETNRRMLRILSSARPSAIATDSRGHVASGDRAAAAPSPDRSR